MAGLCKIIDVIRTKIYYEKLINYILQFFAKHEARKINRGNVH